MKHHQTTKHSTITAQLVLELTGVQCLTIPPGWLHLKSLMCIKPILQQPDYMKAFFLATDASAYSVGAILSQEGELNP